jgi:tetratricopeptide (TPR) repeat protein
MRTRLLGALALALALSACAAAPVPQDAAPAAARPPEVPAAGMPVFGPPRPTPPARSNAEIAADILELAFRMESGRPLPVLTRFEGPVSVALTGAVPPTAGPDLARLIGRLRSEAGIDIRPAAPGAAAAITVEFLPRRRLQSAVPLAACFVVPNVSGWDEFLASRGSARLDWARLSVRERVAVFVPSDGSPQEVRDCLHEEIAQALGPLNDLYRLSDSVFNDDNFNAVLTGFDMLVLRAINAPDLASGMTEAEVARRLPALLARLNPAGEGAPPSPAFRASPEPRAWNAAVEAALGPLSSPAQRAAATRTAVRIAQAEGWSDVRAGFAFYALGRLSSGREADLAVASFLRAAAIFRTLPGGAIHVAHAEMQLAAYALSAGQFDRALDLANRNLRAVTEAENAALLATLLMVRAVALEALGRPAEARAARLDLAAWARYGFGSDTAARARLAEIEALAALGRRRRAGGTGG